MNLNYRIWGIPWTKTTESEESRELKLPNLRNPMNWNYRIWGIPWTETTESDNKRNKTRNLVEQKMRIGRVFQTIMNILFPIRLFYFRTCRKRFLILTIFFKLIEKKPLSDKRENRVDIIFIVIWFSLYTNNSFLFFRHPYLRDNCSEYTFSPPAQPRSNHSPSTRPISSLSYSSNRHSK